MSGTYEEFIASKQLIVPPCGFEPAPIKASLFPFQMDIVRWAVRRGRAAIFADTGTGKSAMQAEWSRQIVEHTGGNVLILAPLAVTQQTVAEGAKFGIEINYRRSQEAVTPGITITNYEMLEKFDVSKFIAVVIDESGILKSVDGKTRTMMIELFAQTPYRLACTATPAPNDHTELGNHCEFLGVMSRVEMLATFFCHDGGETQTWRLKGHAEESFWKWVCTWSVAIRKPSDLGHDDTGYNLPPLSITHHTVEMEMAMAREAGMLFAMPAATLTEQRAAKRASLGARVQRAVEIVAAEPEQQWLVWCELNAESTAVAQTIPGAVEITGSHDARTKASRMLAFARGEIKVLVSKTGICGAGMNFQSCARQVHVGVTHSYEKFYQSTRRSYRYGQKQAVHVHVIASSMEGAVVESLRRKEVDMARMQVAMIAAMRDTQIANVRGSQGRESIPYAPAKRIQIPVWLVSEAA